MYVTTSIPYVNAAPHIGHALEFIQADVLARYYKLKGQEVILQTGTDENAFKNVLAARKLGIPTQELVDRNAGIFKDLVAALDVNADEFIRTTETRHHLAVESLWNLLDPKDLYRKKYQGLYCDGCEDFYQEKDLVDGLCPDHQTTPRLVKEENVFFRLSSYQEKLVALIESGRLKITPERRKSEILAFINRGLQDISMSRSAERAGGWGIKVPNDPSQVIYVWIDALVNYISGQNELLEERVNQEVHQWICNKTWIEQNPKIHVIGKNIWKFHAIYWPALLLSSKCALPNELVIHGFLTNEGKKVSKSLGNTIDPFEFIRKYGSDGLRHYLTSLSPFDDGDFTAERIQTVYTKDCVNTLGNVIKRVTTLAQRSKHDFRRNFLKEIPGVHQAFENRELDRASQILWAQLRILNQSIEHIRPWDLLKNNDPKIHDHLHQWLNEIYNLAHWLSPFMPKAAAKVASMNPHQSDLILFPKVEEKK